MSYDAGADSYTTRVRELLDKHDEASLLYAALELRCGVEARMKEYLDPLDHIPKAHKKQYSVLKLGKSIDNAFQLKEHIALFTICSPAGGIDVTLRYIPVPKRLREIAAQAGDALHFPGEKSLDDPKWWERLRKTIEEGYRWFAFAASGDLIGMPLLNRRTKQTNLRIFLWADDPRSEALSRLAQGAEHVIRVAYEPIPSVLPEEPSK